MKLSRVLMRGKGRESGIESVPLRRSSRLVLAIDVILRGKDEGGQPFREQTQTVDVGRYGAKMATRHRLEPGAQVLIENAALQRTAIAKVVWRGDKHSPQEPFPIGVELLELFEPERIWGLKSPPRDWQEDSPRPTLAQELEYVAAREWARRTEFPNEAEQPIPSAPSELPAAEQAAQTTSSIRRECALAVLEDQGGAADRTASPVAQSFGMSVAELVDPVAQKLQELAETARRSADEAARSIDLAAEAAVARLQAAEKKIEAGFQATAGNSQKSLAALSASSTEALQHGAYALLEELREQLQNALDGLRQKSAQEVTAELRKIGDELLERSVQQFQRQASDTADQWDEKARAWEAGLAGKAAEQLEGLVQASLSCLTKAAHESRGELAEAASRSADQAAHSITAAAGSAMASLQTHRESMEASLTDMAEKVQRRLAEAQAFDTKRLRCRAEALFKDCEEQLQNILSGLEQKGAKQLSAQLQKVTEDLLERSAKELQKRATDTVEALSHKVEASETGLAYEARQQIEGLVQASLQSLTKAVEDSRDELAETARHNVDEAMRRVTVAAESALGRFQTLGEKTEASIQTTAGDAQKRLEEQTASHAEAIQRKADTLFQDFQSQLQGTLNGLEGKGAKQLTTQLQNLELLERSAKEFQKQATDTVEALSHKVEALETGLADEARQQIEGLVQASLQSLTKAVEDSRDELAETARHNVDEAMRRVTVAAESALGRFQTLGEKTEASIQTTAGDAQKRLEEQTTSHAEAIQRKADTLLQGFDSQLQNALNGSEQKQAKAVTDQLQKTASDVVERSARKLQKQANDTVEKLNEKQASLVQDTGEQLRSLAQASLKSLTKIAEQSNDQLRQMAGEFVARSRELEAEHGKSLKKQGEDLFQGALERLRYESYGAKPTPAQRPRGSQVALWLAAIAPTILLIYLSARPVTRLRDEPPTAFFDARQGLSAKQAATAERLARAYWDWASQHLQRRYPFGTKLPSEPPPGFEVDGRDFPRGLEGDVVKLRYWRKLREIWGQPQAWETSYQWDRWHEVRFLN